MRIELNRAIALADDEVREPGRAAVLGAGDVEDATAVVFGRAPMYLIVDHVSTVAPG